MSERIVRVWDAPTRVFHWLLFVLVLGSVISVKIGGNAMIWHGRFGHLIFGLIVFRIVWGVLGSTYVRFSQFVPRPGDLIDYLRGRWQGIGHNPLGALSVLALIGMLAFQSTTGLFANDDIAFNGPLRAAVSGELSNRISGWHRQSEWLIYALVALHICAVVYYAVVRKDNLIMPMITGNKTVRDPQPRPAHGGGAAALAVALGISFFALWISGGGLLPEPPPPPPDLGW